MAQILVVDDEVGIRELLSEILSDEGHNVTLAENGCAARAARDAWRPDLVLLDIWMPDTDGITLLKEWAAAGQLGMPVIMMSGHGTIDTAVEATRIGAQDFLEKPIALQKLLASVKRALTKTPESVISGRSLSLAAFPRSAALRDLKKRFEQVAGKSRVVMLRSARGGIVELVARTLHTPGKAWVNLAHDSTPLTLQALQAAAGGLLYTEELGLLSRLQQKNLWFAAERLDKFNLRLVFGNTHDMTALLEHGWDETQLMRLFDVWLGTPALAELRDEIPEMAGHLLTQYAEAEEIKLPPPRFTTAALNALRQHGWPGGYAELKGAVKSLALGALEEEIGADEVAHLLAPLSDGKNGASDTAGRLSPEMLSLPLREAREAFERAYFEHHLRLNGGNISRLAEKTGIERTHLYRKLKDLGLRSVRKGEEEA